MMFDKYIDDRLLQVDIVHGHQSTSFMSAEGILFAKTMGYKAVYTDHSLFGFADIGAVHINKMIKFWLSEIDHVICVSHTSRENLVLRAYLDPREVTWSDQLLAVGT